MLNDYFQWNISMSDDKNNQSIILLSVNYKILAFIMSKNYVVGIAGPYVCGFILAKSTTDQLLTIRRILDKT